MTELQRLTQEYVKALCDAPHEHDGKGILLHENCGCPEMLTDWYYDVMVANQ